MGVDLTLLVIADAEETPWRVHRAIELDRDSKLFGVVRLFESRLVPDAGIAWGDSPLTRTEDAYGGKLRFVTAHQIMSLVEDALPHGPSPRDTPVVLFWC